MISEWMKLTIPCPISVKRQNTGLFQTESISTLQIKSSSNCDISLFDKAENIVGKGKNAG